MSSASLRDDRKWGKKTGNKTSVTETVAAAETHETTEA